MKKLTTLLMVVALGLFTAVGCDKAAEPTPVGEEPVGATDMGDAGDADAGDADAGDADAGDAADPATEGDAGDTP